MSATTKVRLQKGMQKTVQVCQGCSPVHSSMSLCWGVYERLEPCVGTGEITDANYIYVDMCTCIYAYSNFFYLDLEVPLYNFDYVKLM